MVRFNDNLGLYQALEVLKKAQEIFPLYFDFLEGVGKTDSNYKNRTGCYLTVVSKESGLIILTSMVGTPPAPKAQNCHDYSIEKAIRLFSHPSHLTSHESRDEKNEQWGGAVTGDSPRDEIIISTSGLPERADSLFSLISGKKHIFNYDTADRIIELADAGDLAEKFVKKHGTLFI